MSSSSTRVPRGYRPGCEAPRARGRGRLRPVRRRAGSCGARAGRERARLGRRVRRDAGRRGRRLAAGRVRRSRRVARARHPRPRTAPGPNRRSPASRAPRVLVVGLAVAPVGLHGAARRGSGGALAGSRRAARRRLARPDGRHGARGRPPRLRRPRARPRPGRPLVAYAYELKTRKTWLRLVHEDTKGRLVGERVTRDGFPSSDVLPAAAPVVLPSGAVRVVEAYDSATIEWARTKNHKDWIGQLVYGTALGSPAGVVKAAAGPGRSLERLDRALPLASTRASCSLTLHQNGETTTILSHHAFLVSLALSPTGPEVGRRRLRRPRGRADGLRGHRRGHDRRLDRARRRPQGLRHRRRRRPAVPARPAGRARLVPRRRRTRRRTSRCPRPSRAAPSPCPAASRAPSGAPAAGTVAALAGDGGRLGAADHPPPRRRRNVLDRRHAARAAARLPRGVRRPGLRSPARVALPDRSRRLRHLSTGCTECCGNVDYSLSANSDFFVFRALDPPSTTP